ncbi:hypothetical protein HMPREF1487_05420 [Pseudomonas sp. HPB0071]|uniref:Uncharacterized protein n=1 Tax=Pseudomonas luteola TaxID=47886 RepID=A0A2X2CY47_PSELU|nr:hypothetical protein HMPREF1487_05420 [Pseudomonas sp. HPB0071]SPZ11621.1 Uncharacterised protein [Pseudomonas luteola]
MESLWATVPDLERAFEALVRDFKAVFGKQERQIK